MANDYYAVLGVARDASADEIKRAYRRLARELHPDVNDDPNTQERFKEVAAAYEVLSDPDKRQMFDMGADPRAPRGGGGPNQGAGFGFDFTDIMDAFFGGQQRGPRTRMRRGQDALSHLRRKLLRARNRTGCVRYLQGPGICSGHAAFLVGSGDDCSTVFCLSGLWTNLAFAMS